MNPVDPLLDEILHARTVSDAMIGTPLQRASSISSTLYVELSYTLTGSVFSLRDLNVDIANGVFVELRDVAGYLWRQFQGSAAHEDMTSEDLEHDGKIERYEGKRDSYYFVPIANGPKSSLRLRVSSGGVAVVGAGAGFTSVVVAQEEVQKRADNLASVLSTYVVDEEVGR
ncbi:hypothetical protein HY497_00505 [Candidatus Woesearchaeota archaeon]|nr:hypothetical protein [Candidatus Woesearchaeota archaeon]